MIAPSFGDIFTSNCLKNGLLPVRLPTEVAADLRRQLREKLGATVTVDLEQQTVTGPEGRRIISTFIRCAGAACSKGSMIFR